MRTFYLERPEDVEIIAKEVLTHFPSNRIFAFYGEMGSGKTTFIKGLCRYLKVKDEPTSPTFSIVNEYKTAGDENVYHFDFYRIESVSELFDLGYEEYVDGTNYCFIEWPELAEDALPQGIVRVLIKVESTGRRRLDVS